MTVCPESESGLPAGYEGSSGQPRPCSVLGEHLDTRAIVSTQLLPCGQSQPPPPPAPDLTWAGSSSLRRDGNHEPGDGGLIPRRSPVSPGL